MTRSNRDWLSFAAMSGCMALVLSFGWWYSEHADHQRDEIAIELRQLRQEFSRIKQDLSILFENQTHPGDVD